MNTDMAMDEVTTNRRTWIVRIVLAAFILAVFALGCLLLLGISPVGRYLQSVEWIREFARLFCN